MSIKRKISILVAVILACIVAFACFSALIVVKSQSNMNNISKRIELKEQAWNIKWLDEVLTHSVSRYILSKDQTWVTRYNDHAAMLDDAIAKAKKLASPEEMKVFDDTQTANDKLVAYETQMFQLVDENKPDEALKVLNGDYVTQKSIYAQAYTSFFDEQGKKLDQDIANNQNFIALIRKLAIISLIVCGLLGIIIIYFGISTIRKIQYESKVIDAHCEQISKGDFTHSLPNNILSSKDEFGGVAKAFNKMIGTMKEIIVGILNESANINRLTEMTKENISELNGQVEEVSATTEELTAGMEATAASTEEMTATSQEIEVEIEAISQKAQEGAEVASGISGKAIGIRAEAVLSQQETVKMYEKTHSSLNKALEQAKAVEQIKVLSDVILQITAQTNLLALNAAIEAARAGESGRGFSVVADEIRKLAEESKSTISQIQDVAKLITSSVENLSVSSVQMLKFVEAKVLNDYKTLVQTSEQYSKDAGYYNDMSMDLSSTTEQLLVATQTMGKAINEIAAASNESSSGIQNIAQKISIVTEKARGIVEQTVEVKQSSGKLFEMISVFKV